MSVHGAGWSVPNYLDRLGVGPADHPSVAGLHALHRAHVTRVPYENVWIWLGERASIDPAESAARIISGRGGYCFQLNGAFSLLLDSLGYQVQLHVGGVTGRDEATPVGADGNHLALTVHGLPAAQAPAGAWLVDVGLGDALHEPLPLVPGRYDQGDFSYRLSRSEVVAGGWRFDHDSAGCFSRMDFDPGPATPADFAEMHQRLSTDPESHFLQTLTVQRRDEAGMHLLRGCALSTITGAGTTKRLYDTEPAWFELLARDFGLHLTHVDHAGRQRLWTRVSAAHQRWLAESAATVR